MHIHVAIVESLIFINSQIFLMIKCASLLQYLVALASNVHVYYMYNLYYIPVASYMLQTSQFHVAKFYNM